MARCGSYRYSPLSGTSQCQSPWAGESSDVPGSARPAMAEATILSLSMAQCTARRMDASRSSGSPLLRGLCQQLKPSSWKPTAGAATVVVPGTSA